MNVRQTQLHVQYLQITITSRTQVLLVENIRSKLTAGVAEVNQTPHHETSIPQESSVTSLLDRCSLRPFPWKCPNVHACWCSGGTHRRSAVDMVAGERTKLTILICARHLIDWLRMFACGMYRNVCRRECLHAIRRQSSPSTSQTKHTGEVVGFELRHSVDFNLHVWNRAAAPLIWIELNWNE